MNFFFRSCGWMHRRICDLGSPPPSNHRSRQVQLCSRHHGEARSRPPRTPCFGRGTLVCWSRGGSRGCPWIRVDPEVWALTFVAHARSYDQSFSEAGKLRYGGVVGDAAVDGSMLIFKVGGAMQWPNWVLGTGTSRVSLECFFGVKKTSILAWPNPQRRRKPRWKTLPVAIPT